jgi:hypothetical protein
MMHGPGKSDPAIKPANKAKLSAAAAAFFASCRRGPFRMDSKPDRAAPPRRQPPLAGAGWGRPTTVISMPASSRRFATRFTSARVTASMRPLRRSI